MRHRLDAKLDSTRSFLNNSLKSRRAVSSDADCQCLTHLWLDDSKQVSTDDKLLGEAVVLIGLEGDAKEAHDAGVAGQV